MQRLYLSAEAYFIISDIFFVIFVDGYFQNYLLYMEFSQQNQKKKKSLLSFHVINGTAETNKAVF